MRNKDIIQLLQDVSIAFTLTGANRFRTIAYQRAADVISGMGTELHDLWEQKINLAQLPGIGDSLACHLDELFSSPHSNYLLSQRELIPETVYMLMKIPKVGPKTAMKLVMEFGLTDPKTVFEKLEEIAKAGKIAPLDGFGEKSQTEIIEGIQVYRQRKDAPERVALPEAFVQAEDIIAYLKQNKHVEEAVPLGSMRRWEATIGDVDIVVLCEDKYAKEIVDYFAAYPKAISVEAQGDNKGAVIAKSGLRIDLRTVSKEQYGAMLQYFTGNKEHNIKLREFALKKGYSINEFGIKNVSTNELNVFETEEALYDFLGLDWISPELRQGSDEIVKAQKHILPELVEEKDIKGDFHIHSIYDVHTSHDLGANTFEELLTRGADLRYDYMAFADHNPSVSGNTEEEVLQILKERQSAVLSSRTRSGIYPFTSLEVDIQPGGTLAFPKSAIDYVDFLIVSIHSSFTLPRDKMTDRILKALSHPKVKIFGHPTGRMIGQRDGVVADWDGIFEYCAQKGIALEINAWYRRLDLPEALVRNALAKGCVFCLDTDTHSLDHLDNMKFAVSVARRAGLTKDDIVNCWNLEKVKEFFK